MTLQEDMIRRIRARIEARHAANDRLEDPVRVTHLHKLLRSMKRNRKSVDTTMRAWRKKRS